MWTYNYTNELYHHGIKGMKWGVRRFQDKNGRLTNAGKKRYSDDNESTNKTNTEETKKKGLTDKQKKYIKIGAAVAGTALVAYGGYKLYKSGKLDYLINKGSRKTESIIKDFDNVKVTEVAKTNVSRIEVPKTNVSRIEVSKVNLTKGIDIPTDYIETPNGIAKVQRLKADGSVFTRNDASKYVSDQIKDRIRLIAKDNQYMNSDINELAKSIEITRKVNAERHKRGLKAPDDMLAKMEQAYAIKTGNWN